MNESIKFLINPVEGDIVKEGLNVTKVIFPYNDEGEMKLLELQSDFNLTIGHKSNPMNKFWKCVPMKKYPKLKTAAHRLL